MAFLLLALFPELQPIRCLVRHMPGPLDTIECSGVVDSIWSRIVWRGKAQRQYAGPAERDSIYEAG